MITIDKKAIAHSFSQAASSYDGVAYFQREVGQALLALLDGHDFSRLLDVGSGSGYFATALSEKAGELIHLDIAQGMLAHAKKTLPLDGQKSSHAFLCGDAEQLPLANSSVDGLYANLSLQWCYQLDTVMNGFARVLAPGGCAAFSTLSTNTLFELREAWQAVDTFTHVNHFLDSKAWLGPIKRAKLELVHHKQQRYVLQFDHLHQLLRELKRLGAHNMNQHRPKGLMGKQKMRQLRAAYESFRHNDQLPATYEVDYWLVSKPHD